MSTHHDHSHALGHSHDHGPANYNRAFLIGVILNLGYVVIEATFGVLSGSLALIADAGHNMSDVLGLLVAWGAAALGKRQPTSRRTYGLRRSSILASLFNAAFLLIATGAIALEAVRRFADPAQIESGTVIWVALIGIAINAGTAFMFMAGRKRDLNIKGAFLHMVADAAVSAGVVVAALAIRWTGWLWLDPAMSLVIVAVIVASTWGLLKSAVNLALDAVPEGIDRDQVEAYLAGLPGVTEVHDLHIWAMSTTETALTAHLVRPDTGHDDALLAQVGEVLHHKFSIEHATFQVEDGSRPCRLAPAGVI